MSKVLWVFVFVIVLNSYMFLGQVSIDKMNPGSSTQFFNYQGSTLQGYDIGNYTLEDDPVNRLPGQQASVSPTTGNVFTDGWAATKNWFLQTTGITYLKAIATAVPNFLKAMGLEPEISFALGYMWYAFSIVIVVFFIKGYYT